MYQYSSLSPGSVRTRRDINIVTIQGAWIQTEYGLVIGFIDNLYTHPVTTINYNAIDDLHTLQITRTQSSLVLSLQRISTQELYQSHCKNTFPNNPSIVSYIFVAAETCLLSRRLAINVYSGSSIPALRRHSQYCDMSTLC
jgi:hypothetical protein